MQGGSPPPDESVAPFRVEDVRYVTPGWQKASMAALDPWLAEQGADSPAAADGAGDRAGDRDHARARVAAGLSEILSELDPRLPRDPSTVGDEQSKLALARIAIEVACQRAHMMRLLCSGAQRHLRTVQRPSANNKSDELDAGSLLALAAPAR